MNMVMKVVKLKIRLEKADRMAARLPKNVLKMLVPVDTMFFMSVPSLFWPVPTSPT